MKANLTPEAFFKHAKIFIVDDQEVNVRLLERILRPAGYTNLMTLSDSRRVLDVYSEFKPDLILLDLHMPHIDGLGVMKLLDPLISAQAYMPILVLTADALLETRQKALSGGAKDFLTKPFDSVEVLLRIHNLLETRFLYVELQEQNLNLENRVRDRTREIEQAQEEMLDRLARASESRDDDTGRHTQRVSQLSAALARAAGLPEAECELIRRAASLHDIGKIGIPDSVLRKPGKLSPQEFAHVKTHAAIGANILSGSRFSMIRLAEQIARYHHERWDGTGYFSLSGEGIPLAARIVTLADVFDVLTHERPYKKAWPVEEAIDEIKSQSGKLFDPKLVELFLSREWKSDLLGLIQAVGPADEVAADAVAVEEVMTRLEP